MTIMPYTFPDTQQPVRTVTDAAGDPWFVVADVCKVLGIGNPSDAARRLNGDDLDSIEVTDALGRSQRAYATNESGLYDLVLDSRKPEARAFRRWITHEVIPSIRRTGHYGAPPPAAPAVPELSRMEILQMAIDSEQGRLVAEARVAELEPAAAAWDQLAASDQDFSVREAALILGRDPHIDTGERRLFAVLRGGGLIDRQDRPYQRHAHHVRLRPRSYRDPVTGLDTPAKAQVRVTVAGLQYLHRRLGGAVSIHHHIADHQLATDGDALFALPR